MKTREEVIALFRDKYEYLKAVCQQQIGPFDESAIYQNPDGGWQLNLEQPFGYKAAITLRPNDQEPHETHGVIGAKWFQEGRAFGENGIPGWLGYPIADENTETVSVDLPFLIDPYPWNDPSGPISIWNSSVIEVSRACSLFEFGRIEFRAGTTLEQAVKELNYEALRTFLIKIDSFRGDYDCPCPNGHSYDSLFLDEWFSAVDEKSVKASDLQSLFRASQDAVFIVPPKLSISLNEAGKRHIPKDIENAIETFLAIQGIHVVGNRSWSGELDDGIRWQFLAEVEEYDDFSILVWREGTDIHAKVNAHSKSFFSGKKDMDGKRFVIPNRFRTA